MSDDGRSEARRLIRYCRLARLPHDVFELRLNPLEARAFDFAALGASELGGIDLGTQITENASTGTGISAETVSAQAELRRLVEG